MIAANRVFDILDTEDQIQDTGTVEAPIFEGNILFKDVRFGYIPDEEVIKGIDLEVSAGQTIAIVGFYWCRKIDYYQFIKSFLRN